MNRFDRVVGRMIARTLAIAGLAVVAVAVTSHAASGADSSATMAINENGFDSSATCGKCHAQIYSQWKGSLHSQATADPIFRAAYFEAHYKSNGKAAKLCLRCHAPTSEITNGYDLDITLTGEAITCDFCHSVKDIHLEKDFPFELDLGVTKYGPRGNMNVKQHKTQKSTLHTDSRFCAGCHEYRPNGLPVMTTYTEWKNGPYADEGKMCQDCHMPKKKGIVATGLPESDMVNHDIAGSHSVVQLKKAVAVRVTGVERGEDRMVVKVDISNVGSGHRLPTGMPTRKLYLFCEVKVPGEQSFKDKIVYEKAIFDKEGNELHSDTDIMLGRGVAIAKDNRLYPKETRSETFTFYIAKNKRVNISVWSEYLYRPILMTETEMKIEMARDYSVSEPR